MFSSTTVPVNDYVSSLVATCSYIIQITVFITVALFIVSVLPSIPKAYWSLSDKSGWTPKMATPTLHMDPNPLSP